MANFNSADEFFKVFEIGESSKYISFTPLEDVKVGFSIQREYPVDGRYRPPMRADGTPDVIAIIHVVYNQEAQVKNIAAERVPVRITIMRYSKWIAQHFFYDFKNAECPTKESIDISNKTPKPLDLIMEGYFNHDDKRFVLESGESMSPRELLDWIFENHIKTTGYLSSTLRTSRHKARDLIGVLIKVIRYYFLEETWHWQIEDSISNAKYYLYGYPESEVRKRLLKELDLFGYSTSMATIILFCCLGIITFSIYHILGINEPFLQSITSNSFLVLIFALFSLYILDNIVPKLLFGLMNILIRFRADYL